MSHNMTHPIQGRFAVTFVMEQGAVGGRRRQFVPGPAALPCTIAAFYITHRSAALLPGVVVFTAPFNQHYSS